MGGTPELAPRAMACALRDAARAGSRDKRYLAQLEERFFAAQSTGFGRGLVRPYSGAWHKDFGLLTDRGDRILLRLGDDGDRAGFRKHVIGHPDCLRHAPGYGAGLAVVSKNFAVTGPLGTEHWDGRMAAGLIDLGLPFLLLPHASGKAPDTEIPPSLDILASVMMTAFDRPLPEPANLPPLPGADLYLDRLRARLRHLPAAFEFLAHRTVRQTFHACLEIALMAGRWSPDATKEETGAVALDLCGHALRGMALGVGALAWHCHGFDPGIARAEAARALDHLRRKGPMGRSDLLRAAHLTREERDVLLERLAAEDLVMLDGKNVAAATFREFVEALHARDEFPPPKNHWAALRKDGDRQCSD